MKLRKDPYEDWDKMFAFFGKFTNEVAMVRSCPPIYNEEKIDYLLDIKGAFSTYVHVVRDLDLKHHKTMPTESQKAEIFRRFDELEKYVEKLVPPRKQWLEEQEMRNRNTTPTTLPQRDKLAPKRFNPKLTRGI